MAKLQQGAENRGNEGTIDRRRFLKTTLVAGAAVFLRKNVFASSIMQAESRPVKLDRGKATIGEDGWMKLEEIPKQDGGFYGTNMNITKVIGEMEAARGGAASRETAGIMAVGDALVVFIKGGGVVGYRINKANVDPAGFAVGAEISSYSLEQTSNPELWRIVVNGESRFSIRSGGRPLDKVLVENQG